MYDAPERKFFWPSMPNDVYSSVDQCASCARNWNCYQHKHLFRLFLATGSLDFLATVDLGPLPIPSNNNHYAIVDTDCYLKLIRAIPSSITTSTLIANIFYDRCIIPNGIPFFLLTGDSTQFASEVFPALYVLIDVEHLTAMA